MLPPIAKTFLLLATLAHSTPLPTDTAAPPDHPQQAKKPFAGPLLDQNFADPAIIKAGDTYYAYSTIHKNLNVPLASSSDFREGWKAGGDALPKLPDWAGRGKERSVWAPDVVQTGSDAFVLYYTSKVANEDGKRCIGVATAKSPLGPFEPQGVGPLICTPKDSKGTVIDPSGFEDPDTKARYLLYRLRDLADRIMIQRLSADGLHKVTDGNSDPTELLHVGPGDGGVTEAPSLIKAVDGTYVLFYSTHGFDTVDYTISVATGKKIEGRYEKKDKPLMDSTIMEKLGGGKFVSPGGADVLPVGQKVDGGLVHGMVFHAAVDKQHLGERKMFVGGSEVGKGGEVRLAETGW